MSAPDKIWAEIDEGGNIFITSGVNKPDEHNMPFFIEYTRADLTPPAADYVAALGLKRIVEEVDGAMRHGTWRDEHGMRLKDTPEWMEFYNSLAARPASPDTRVDVEALAAALWREEAVDAGAPDSIASGRTAEAFADQSSELRARWMKFAACAIRYIGGQDRE